MNVHPNVEHRFGKFRELQHLLNRSSESQASLTPEFMVTPFCLYLRTGTSSFTENLGPESRQSDASPPCSCAIVMGSDSRPPRRMRKTSSTNTAYCEKDVFPEACSVDLLE